MPGITITDLFPLFAHKAEATNTTEIFYSFHTELLWKIVQLEVQNSSGYILC